MKWLDPSLWLLVLGVGLISFGAGDLHGHRDEARENTTIQAKADEAVATAKTRAILQVAQAEKDMGKLLDARDAEHQRENEHAEKKFNALRADVAAGRVRFTVATSTPKHDANPGDTAPQADYHEARAELLPETADAFIAVAADSARDVRDLNACIDDYNSVRNTVNALRVKINP